ncbi:MAG TPA: type II secretion system protein [Patescibacteria group bacterium]|nr:type II secretion system protein [Patescibacteria group bacterium]
MRQRGFTLIELMITISVFLILLAFAAPNILRTRNSAVVNTSIDTVLADIKQQQLKSMVGDTGGSGNASSYGVYFGTTSYTLFKGSTYNSSDTTNVVVPLEGSVQFSNVTLLNSQVVFARGTGEISGFVTGQDSFSLSEPSGGRVTSATFNKYGVVITEN